MLRQRDAWRHVLLITDMQRSAWQRVIEQKLIEKVSRPVPVTIVDMGEPDAPNRYIRQVRVREGAAVGTFAVEAELAGRGGAAGDQVSLWVDGQKVGSP